MIHIRVLLILTVLAFVCYAQRNQAGQQCLCSKFRKSKDARNNISNIQIFPITDFCRKAEIIITNKQGDRYCVNPNVGSRVLSESLRRKSKLSS